jgi:hypothetical protein
MSNIKTDSLYNWKNITEEFKTSCMVLKLGELLKDES